MDRRASSRFRALFYPQPPRFSQKQRDFPQIVHFRIPHNSQTSGTWQATPLQSKGTCRGATCGARETDIPLCSGQPHL